MVHLKKSTFIALLLTSLALVWMLSPLNAQHDITTIEYGDHVEGQIVLGEGQGYVFRGQADEVVNIAVDTDGVFEPFFSLYRTDDNTLLGDGVFLDDSGVMRLVNQILPVTGEYYIFVGSTANINTVFTLSLSLGEPITLRECTRRVSSILPSLTLICFLPKFEGISCIFT